MRSIIITSLSLFIKVLVNLQFSPEAGRLPHRNNLTAWRAKRTKQTRCAVNETTVSVSVSVTKPLLRHGQLRQQPHPAAGG